MDARYGDVVVELHEDFVATVEVQRPPNNFFDIELIASLAGVYEALDRDRSCRAIVLCSKGKHFCAGADFASPSSAGGFAAQRDAPDAGTSGAARGSGNRLYAEAVRLFATGKPVVAAVQGAAIGGGLGLACSADFRVGSVESRFAANFSQLGFHHGFGLTVTLPDIVGQQCAYDLLYTGRRIRGDEAHRMGLCDRLVPAPDLRATAHALAGEIATSAPLAVRSIRHTLRGDLASRIRDATRREGDEQDRLRRTRDWEEGVRAAAERRPPTFEER